MTDQQKPFDYGTPQQQPPQQAVYSTPQPYAYQLPPQNYQQTPYSPQPQGVAYTDQQNQGIGYQTGYVPPTQGSVYSHHHGEQETPSCCPPAALEVFFAYFFGWIGGLLVVLLEKSSFYCVFHAWQSIFLSVITCIGIIPAIVIDIVLASTIGFSFVLTIWVLFMLIIILITMIIAMARGKSGRLFRLPLIGILAERLASSKNYQSGYSRA